MGFLSFNGIEFSVSLDTITETVEEIGDTSRAYDGTLRKSRQTVKRNANFESPPLLSTDFIAWDQFLRGLGERWSFDTTMFGSKGRGPNATTGLTITAGSLGKFGEGLEVAANNPVRTFVAAAGLGSAWTVAVWRKLGAGAYVSYVVTSNGNKWVDGASNDGASTTWLTVSGSVTLEGDTASVVRYDDLVILPFVVLSGWAPVFSSEGVAGRAWTNLPDLRASGDSIAEATSRTVQCNPTTSDLLKAVLSGSFRTNARTLSVEMNEV